MVQQSVNSLDGLAKNATLYALPLVIMDITREQMNLKPNGWSGTGSKMKKGFGTDYQTRALISIFGLGANLPVEPFTSMQTLINGDKN
jgi:hypothetical protein